MIQVTFLVGQLDMSNRVSKRKTYKGVRIAPNCGDNLEIVEPTRGSQSCPRLDMSKRPTVQPVQTGMPAGTP